MLNKHDFDPWWKSHVAKNVDGWCHKVKQKSNSLSLGNAIETINAKIHHGLNENGVEKGIKNCYCLHKKLCTILGSKTHLFHNGPLDLAYLDVICWLSDQTRTPPILEYRLVWIHFIHGKSTNTNRHFSIKKSIEQIESFCFLLLWSVPVVPQSFPNDDFSFMEHPVQEIGRCSSEGGIGDVPNKIIRVVFVALVHQKSQRRKKMMNQGGCIRFFNVSIQISLEPTSSLLTKRGLVFYLWLLRTYQQVEG